MSSSFNRQAETIVLSPMESSPACLARPFLPLQDCEVRSRAQSAMVKGSLRYRLVCLDGCEAPRSL